MTRVPYADGVGCGPGCGHTGLVATQRDSSVRTRSPWIRALVPNLAGLAVIVVIGLLLWFIAAYISSGATETSDRLAPSELRVGSITNVSEEIAQRGPILFPGLGTTEGERTLVLDHTGDDPATQWIVYYAYPADRDPTCAVEQVRTEGAGTRDFIDCTGRTIDVAQLAPPPPGVNPVVEGVQLSIDLSGVTDGSGDD